MKMIKKSHKNKHEIVKENLSEEEKDKKSNTKETDRRICGKNIKKAKRIWKKTVAAQEKRHNKIFIGFSCIV